jgi:hypothetical protein
LKETAMRNQLLIASYGVPESRSNCDFRDWWEKTEAWANALGVPPNEISGRFRTKPRRLVNSNGYALANYRTRFEKELDANNVEELSLMKLAREWRYKAVDWDFAADYGRFADAFDLFLGAIDLGCLGNVLGLSPTAFVHEVEGQRRSHLAINYGFAVVMPRDFMPGGYALGVAARELPPEMNMDANAWMQYHDGKPGCRECGRTLRNVYGYNILNARHLDIDVGGRRLEDWIKAASGRGRIDPLEGGLFLWRFQEGDDQEKFLWWDYPPVVGVREELKKFKVFPWQRLAGIE